MTFDLGMVTEFDDAVTVQDPIVLARASAIKLAANQAVFWNLMGAPSEALTGTSFEVYGRGLTAQAGVIGDGIGGGWDNAATTALKMTAAAVNVLTIGTVIKVEDEIVVVSAVDRSTNVIAVFERGAGSTAAAAHADTVAFSVIGVAINDTDLKNIESFAEESNVYTNYVQLVAETVDYAQRAKILNRKGLTDTQIATLQEEAMQRMAAKLARMSLNGVKRQGTASIPAMTAGLYEQLADTAGATRPVLTYNAGGAAFSETILKAALEDAFEKGNPKAILLSQKYKNILNGFNQAFINTTRQDKVAGYSVSQYEYEGKILDVYVDQDCQDGKVAIITPEKCRKGWLANDTLQYVAEPAASSREHRDSLQGSVGLVVEGVGYDHILIYGLA